MSKKNLLDVFCLMCPFVFVSATNVYIRNSNATVDTFSMAEVDSITFNIPGWQTASCYFWWHDANGFPYFECYHRKEVDSIFFVAPATTVIEEEDLRAFQHGLDCLLLPNGNYVAIWSSTGNPPTGPDKDGEWQDDVYYAFINPITGLMDGVKSLISYPMAQEPASSAINSDGHIMVTMEDAWNAGDDELYQRYGVYDTCLKPIKAYPQTVYAGGHSGHVAAVGNRFVVFYSEGWINGGGVDNLGSGDDVRLASFDTNGSIETEYEVAVGNSSRDWWPLIAGSADRACLVWQQYIPKKTYAKLVAGIYNPHTNSIEKRLILEADSVKYYTYDVQYIPDIDRFLVIGSYQNGKGFAYLIDEEGNITAFNTDLPNGIVRESQAIVREQQGTAMVIYPVLDNKLIQLVITANTICCKNVFSNSIAWNYMGTDGFWMDGQTLYMLTLSPDGIRQKIMTVPALP